jgi:hypothetical protein
VDRVLLMEHETKIYLVLDDVPGIQIPSSISWFVERLEKSPQEKNK